MPRISVFHGIVIAMYWNEGSHARPHFHARYGEHKASVDFAGAVVAGSLPDRQLGLVEQWCRLHAHELVANWERARRSEPLDQIDPLP